MSLGAANFYKCIALDIGGVICADSWETLFLTPDKGLVSYYNLDPETVLQEGARLWDLYSYNESDEENYWQSWEDILGIEFDRTYIANLYNEVCWVDLSIRRLIESALSKKIQVSFVSNSTSFWFAKQMKLAGITDLLPKISCFLSHEVGHKKTHPRGGLALLATKTDPKKILFIDDRYENIEAANNLGIAALCYRRGVHENIANFIIEHLDKLRDTQNLCKSFKNIIKLGDANPIGQIDAEKSVEERKIFL